ncbi:MAG: beta-galactosidase, partial [Phycisphaerae bacterium]|nr:beta-galactosidase [Phycisphaerae bacterium]
MNAHIKFSPIGSVPIFLVAVVLCLNVACPAVADSASKPEGSNRQPLPIFRGGSSITASPRKTNSGVKDVPFIKPKPISDKFLILIWQYKTDVRKDLDLYKKLGFHGFHIDRGSGKEAIVAFARKHRMAYYVDHAADKGYLHLTDRTGRKRIMRKRTVVSRPHSLADPKTMTILKNHIRKNVSVTKRGPVVAYAFDDEVSIGVFNSPCEVDGSPVSVTGYHAWLRKTYGNIDSLNRTWGTNLKNFSQAQPVSFEKIRRAHTKGPFSRWNLSQWMDWRSYMDTQFAKCLTELTLFTNKIDPNTPAGIVGGQQPAPYGGYDYSKICRSVQWIESYDIGGTCEILRSLWCRPQRRPYVQTWFSTGDTRRDAWFLWYYLLHGNRGVIAWPDRGGSWFHQKDGGIAPFIIQNAATIREVQSALSKHILNPDARFDADPIAVYYSHPSIQASWVMDVVTHRGTWPNRSSSLDNTCQTAAKNRVAWFKLLEDCGFQYNV